MTESPVSVRNYSYMYSCGKGAARQQENDSQKSKNTFGYLIITRTTRDGSMNGEGTQLCIRVQWY